MRLLSPDSPLPTADEARGSLMEFLQIDEAQAQAIPEHAVASFGCSGRRKIQDRHDELMRMIAEYNAIIASETRQREIISEELGEIVNRYGDERRTQIMYVSLTAICSWKTSSLRKRSW